MSNGGEPRSCHPTPAHLPHDPGPVSFPAVPIKFSKTPRCRSPCRLHTLRVPRMLQHHGGFSFRVSFRLCFLLPYPRSFVAPNCLTSYVILRSLYFLFPASSCRRATESLFYRDRHDNYADNGKNGTEHEPLNHSPTVSYHNARIPTFLTLG